MKFIGILGLSLFLLSCGSSPKSADSTSVKNGVSKIWENCDHCGAPESAFYDEKTGVIFVSNIHGEGTAKDGNGTIQKISPDGKVLDAKWVTGLNAPKGLRAHGSKLWVTDIDEVLSIDIPSGKIEFKLRIRGAKFLNDLAIDENGVVYVSDTLDSRIYRIKNGRYKTVVKGSDLESPNGLLVQNGKLLVAAWGLTTDWSTKVPGRLYEIDLKTMKRTYITPAPLGNLDGLEVLSNGDYLISDWSAGKVFRVDQKGNHKVLVEGVKGSADIALLKDQNIFVVPAMQENKIMGFKISN